MQVFVLDIQSKSREQMLQWLSEDKRVKGVQVFEDYIRFIEQVGKSPPDLCFIQLGKDEIPGLRVAEIVRQISSDIRIVFVSADRGYAIDAFEIGAYGYLLCPIVKSKLEEILNKAGL